MFLLLQITNLAIVNMKFKKHTLLTLPVKPNIFFFSFINTTLVYPKFSCHFFFFFIKHFNSHLKKSSLTPSSSSLVHTLHLALLARPILHGLISLTKQLCLKMKLTFSKIVLFHQTIRFCLIFLFPCLGIIFVNILLLLE